jgi:hypothetical protein
VVTFLDETSDSSLLYSVQTGFEAHSASYPMTVKVSSLGREAKYLQLNVYL